MKKNDILALNRLKPKKETFDFLMKFSKNLQAITTKNQIVFLITKN